MPIAYSPRPEVRRVLDSPATTITVTEPSHIKDQAEWDRRKSEETMGRMSGVFDEYQVRRGILLLDRSSREDTFLHLTKYSETMLVEI